MQSPNPNLPHTWADVAPYLVAIILAIPGWFVAWWNRRKTHADADLSDAQSVKERAQSRKFDADVVKMYQDVLREVNADLRTAERERNAVEVERDHWKDRYEMLERELDKFRHGGNGKAK